MSDPGLFFTPGSCDAASLATILVVAAVTALVPVRLPGDVLITFLPAMLLPSWLVCGGLPTSDVAVVASIIAGLVWTRRAVPTVLRVGAALTAAVVGGLAGAATTSILGSLAQAPPEGASRLLPGALFAGGYWLGEAMFIEIARRLGFAELLSVQPRSNVVANLLLLFP